MTLASRLLISFLLVFALVAEAFAVAQQNIIKVAVAELPDVAKHPKEVLLVNLLQAIDEQLPDTQIELLRMPFARSIVELARGHVDAQLPIMYDPNDALGATEYMLQLGIKLSDLAYTDENLFRAHFVIVTREEIKITPDSIENHEVVTDISHVAFFKNQFPGTHSMKASIARVQKGTLAGYLFEEHKVNQVIRELDFVDHRLNTWALYDVRFMVRNNEQGHKIKKMLDESVAILKRNGAFENIMHQLINEHGY